MVCAELISSVNVVCSNANNLQKHIKNKPLHTNTISFRGNRYTTQQIQNLLLKKGIKSEFSNREYVANCFYNVINTYEKLFGNSYLPREVSFTPQIKNIYAKYNHDKDTIACDNKSSPSSSWISKLSHSINGTSKTQQSNINSDKPLVHPAYIYAYEFSRAALLKNLDKRLGHKKAQAYWSELNNMKLPQPLVNIAAYSSNTNNLASFIIERITQDVCRNISPKGNWDIVGHPDVRYEDIFKRRWNSKKSSPQSYIDYYTEMVWNGGIKQAERVTQETTNLKKEPILNKKIIAYIPLVTQLQKVPVLVKQKIPLLSAKPKEEFVLRTRPLKTKVKTEVTEKQYSIIPTLNKFYENIKYNISDTFKNVKLGKPNYRRKQVNTFPKIANVFGKLLDKAEDTLYDLKNIKFETPNWLINSFDRTCEAFENLRYKISLIFDKRERERYRDEKEAEKIRRMISPFLNTIQERMNELRNTPQKEYYSSSKSDLSEKVVDFFDGLKDGLFGSISERNSSSSTNIRTKKENEKSFEDKVGNTIGNFLNIFRDDDRYEEPQKRLW